MTTPSDVWIGLLELVGPRTSPILEGSTGAFVSYIAIARDQNEYENQAREAVGDLGLTLQQTHWSERLADRRAQYDIEEYLLRSADEVERTRIGAFGSFHVWAEDAELGSPDREE